MTHLARWVQGVVESKQGELTYLIRLNHGRIVHLHVEQLRNCSFEELVGTQDISEPELPIEESTGTDDTPEFDLPDMTAHISTPPASATPVI